MRKLERKINPPFSSCHLISSSSQYAFAGAANLLTTWSRAPRTSPLKAQDKDQHQPYTKKNRLLFCSVNNEAANASLAQPLNARQKAVPAFVYIQIRYPLVFKIGHLHRSLRKLSCRTRHCQTSILRLPCKPAHYAVCGAPTVKSIHRYYRFFPPQRFSTHTRMRLSLTRQACARSRLPSALRKKRRLS